MSFIVFFNTFICLQHLNKTIYNIIEKNVSELDEIKTCYKSFDILCRIQIDICNRNNITDKNNNNNLL